MTGSAVRVLTLAGKRTGSWVPVGILGGGVRAGTVERGIALGADVIAVGAGSTDALFGHRHPEDGLGRRGPRPQGPDAGSPLGRYPLVVRSCGTSGMDAGGAWVQQIAQQIALEEGFVLRVACLFSELQSAQAEKLRSAGRVRPRGPEGLAGRCYARPLQPRRRPHGARADRSCRPGRR